LYENDGRQIILLNNCSVLKHFKQRGVFIASDETVDVRRKQTLDCLKYRAERANKAVSVVDGVLSVEGNAVLSLATGFISNAHHG